MQANWNHITEKMHAIVQQKIQNGQMDTQLTHPGVDPIALREVVVTRMLRCVDTLTLQCMILDYDVGLASETDGVLHRVNRLRNRIFDPALNIQALGDMLQLVRNLECDLMSMLSRRLKLLHGDYFVAE